MNRFLVAALVLSASTASAGAALAATAGSSTPAAVTRVTHYYAAGPSASYDGDVGGIGEVPATRVAVPSGHGTYDAVVTVSLQYRTRGAGVFVAELDVRSGRVDSVRPDESVLRPSPTATSTTVRFVVTGLRAGEVYDVRPGVNGGGAGRTTSIVSSRVVMTVDLTPR